MLPSGLMSAPSRPSNPYTTRSQTDYTRRATNSVQSVVPPAPAGNSASAYYAQRAARETLRRDSLSPRTGATQSSMPSYPSDRAQRLDDLASLQEAAYGRTQPTDGVPLGQRAGGPLDEAALAAYVRETMDVGSRDRGIVPTTRSFRRRTSERNRNPLDRAPSNVSAAGVQTCTGVKIHFNHCLTTFYRLHSTLAEAAALANGHAAVSCYGQVVNPLTAQSIVLQLCPLHSYLQRPCQAILADICHCEHICAAAT